MHRAAWSRMESPYKLQILQEPHRDSLNKSRDAWSRMEPPYKLQILQEPHGDPLNQGSANFSRWGPDLDFLDLPGPKREKKSFRFKSISDFAIFSPKL